MAGRKTGRGGPRRGAGRPTGSGRPVAQVRRNRLVITMRDDDLRALEKRAEEQGLPLATVAYRLLMRALGKDADL